MDGHQGAAQTWQGMQTQHPAGPAILWKHLEDRCAVEADGKPPDIQNVKHFWFLFLSGHYHWPNPLHQQHTENERTLVKMAKPMQEILVGTQLWLITPWMLAQLSVEVS